MRHLLATVILGSSLAAVVPAFADNHADKSAPAFGSVRIEAVDIESGMAGTETAQNSLHQYRLDNIGQ